MDRISASSPPLRFYFLPAATHAPRRREEYKVLIVIRFVCFVSLLFPNCIAMRCEQGIMARQPVTADRGRATVLFCLSRYLQLQQKNDREPKEFAPGHLTNPFHVQIVLDHPKTRSRFVSYRHRSRTQEPCDQNCCGTNDRSLILDSRGSDCCGDFDGFDCTVRFEIRPELGCKGLRKTSHLPRWEEHSEPSDAERCGAVRHRSWPSRHPSDEFLVRVASSFGESDLC